MSRHPATPADGAPQDDTRPAVTLLQLLICADIAFIVLHLVYIEVSALRGVRLSLEAEGGMAETYQYVKEFWIAACMAAAFRRTRVPLYASWALVFAFVLFDDALQIHERAGAWLGRAYALPTMFGLRPDDVGELLFAAMVGASVLALVGVATWRGGEQARRISRDMLCLLTAFAILGVLVDTLHVVAYVQRSLVEQLLLVVEDGGEMLVMSALTAYAFHVASLRGRTRFDLWAMLRARVGFGPPRDFLPSPEA